jgi:hypothetical protein
VDEARRQGVTVDVQMRLARSAVNDDFVHVAGGSPKGGWMALMATGHEG